MRRAHGLEDELGEADLVAVEAHGAGVVAADLQQVLDQLTEAADLGGDEVDGLLAAVVEPVALAVRCRPATA